MSSELVAAKEKLEIVKSRGEAAPLKTVKASGEKHRREPYFNAGKRNFLIQYRNLEKALSYGLFLLARPPPLDFKM